MPLTEVTTEQTLAMLQGKRIAIVGNSPEILDQRNAPYIDGADVVIRMNGATPSRFSEFRNAIGTRTDILACGNIQPFEVVLQEIPPHFWWMKVTEHGAKKHRQFKQWMTERQEATLWQWPDKWEADMRRRIGAPGSSGIRIIEVCTWAGASVVDIYGMTFWGAGEGKETSWYSGKPIHPSHDARLEYEHFLKSEPMFVPHPKEPGRWSWTSKPLK